MNKTTVALIAGLVISASLLAYYKKVLLKNVDIWTTRYIGSMFVVINLTCLLIVLHQYNVYDFKKIKQVSCHTVGLLFGLSILVLIPGMISLYLIQNNEVGKLTVWTQPLILLTTAILGMVWFDKTTWDRWQISGAMVILIGTVVFLRPWNTIGQ